MELRVVTDCNGDLLLNGNDYCARVVHGVQGRTVSQKPDTMPGFAPPPFFENASLRGGYIKGFWDAQPIFLNNYGGDCSSV